MNDPKIAKFILEQELPPDSATPSPTAPQISEPKPKPIKSMKDRIRVLDHVRQINLEACRDPHLEEYLPHLLDAQLCRTIDNRWIVVNPVHSLHLASQVDESQQQPQQNVQQQLMGWKQNPLLFGDEEQRTIVLKSMGVAETWCPLDGASTGLEEDRIWQPSELPPRFNDMMSPMGSMIPPFSPSSAMAVQPMVARSAINGIPPSPGMMPMDVEMNQAASGQPPMTPKQILSSPGYVMSDAASPVVAQANGSELMAPPNQINPKALGGKNLGAIKSVISPSKANGSAPPGSTGQMLSQAAPTPGQGSRTESQGKATPFISSPNKTANGGQDAVQDGQQGNGKGGKGLVLAKLTGSANTNTSGTPTTQVKPSDQTKPAENAATSGATAAPNASNTSAKADELVPPTTKSSQQVPGQPPTDGHTPKSTEMAVAATIQSSTLQPPPSDLGAFVPPNPLIPISVPSSSGESNGLTDEQCHQLRLAENSIEMVRRSIATYGRTMITTKKKSESAKKKRKKDLEFFRCAPMPGWVAPPPRELSNWEEGQWSQVRRKAPETVERWMENFRISRGSYWSESSLKKATTDRGMMERRKSSFYMPTQDSSSSASSNANVEKSGKASKRKRSRVFTGDELMTCLECGFNGCSPKSIAPGSDDGMLEHMLTSGHKFAVTCGNRAQVFSFGAGDFVYHEIFDQEKFRMDTMKQLPNLAWKEHKIQRSFDPFQFLSTKEHGIVWRGPVATYPPLVPREHLRATELIRRRKSLFEGQIREKWLLTKPNAMAFAASQNLLEEGRRYQIDVPVGMYNLGNTCYMTAILQCLVHCNPLQQYFLRDSAHHYKASMVYRDATADDSAQDATTSTVEKPAPKDKKEPELCLAYEMDKLFLSYYGSAIGHDVLSVIEESSHSLCFGVSEADDTYVPTATAEVEKGEPLIPSSLLATIWKSEHLKHLAGYKQHDSHEFLNSFLEQMSKNIKQHRDRVVESINTARDDNCVIDNPEREPDVVTRLFEGQLRSVLLCEECGTKRVQAEPFMNISLTLSEEVERLETESNIDGDGAKLSVQTCLDHYVLPERLADPVECPSCGKRTSTKTQHTFSKLPKILCLHLKRFDAARNKKIEEFVSFPARGLNMGPLLSHWSEVSSVLSTKPKADANAEPRILYDLFGTANHLGNMQSGHYVSNVKVKDQWYHCNDQHIIRAGEGNGEEAVLNSEGAYILFYIRR